MPVLLVGCYSGVSKKNGNEFFMLHCVKETDREQKGLYGRAVESYFCTPEVFRHAKENIDKRLILRSDFGSRSVSDFEVVEE